MNHAVTVKKPRDHPAQSVTIVHHPRFILSNTKHLNTQKCSTSVIGVMLHPAPGATL